MKAKLKWLLLAGVLGLAAVAFVFLRDPMHGRLHAQARKEWKDAAIAILERKTADRTWVEREIAVISAKLGTKEEGEANWHSGEMLLMKDGSWIAYAAKCSKEDSRIHDIFIGRLSDGKWYYSTHHFCIKLFDLRYEDQPQGLSQFIAAFSLREFDGQSDECLKRTWPKPAN
jgi:hypothetical protein